PVPLVDETAVGPLSLLEGLEQFLAPVVFLAGGVLEAIFAQGVHRLGEGAVVIVQPRLPQPGVLLQGVMATNPVQGCLHARIVLRDAGIQETLQSGIGHGSLGAQATLGGLVLLVVGVKRRVDEAAPVVLAGLGGKGLIVALLLVGVVLATRDELQRSLDGGI